MKQTALILSFVLCILTSCVDKDSNEKTTLDKADTLKTMLTDAEIIEHIKKAINPKFKSWVAFSNGTYIILEDSTVVDSEKKAVEIMKEYGPVHAGSPAGDITTIKLTYTEGWVVGGHHYGMYTYVNPAELPNDKPTDIEVGLAGRQKRDKDGKDLKVIYINK